MINTEKKRILVVDDEVIIADDLSNTLTKLGYEVLEPALNYNEAIKTFDEEPIDLVVLDINLGTKKLGLMWPIISSLIPILPLSISLLFLIREPLNWPKPRCPMPIWSNHLKL